MVVNQSRIIAVIFFIFMAFGLSTICVAQALKNQWNDEHPWDRHIRGYRQEHHFGFSLGGQRGVWQVRGFGEIAEEVYESQGIYGKLSYSFHIPLGGPFGYILGSTLGYSMGSSKKNDDFRPSPSTHFPGLYVGFDWNVNPRLRFVVGADSYLERLDGIREGDDSSQGHEVSLSMLAFLDASLMVDFFYDLDWGVRLEFHERNVRYQAPRGSEDRAEGLFLVKEDQWLGMGLIYHFL